MASVGNSSAMATELPENWSPKNNLHSSRTPFPPCTQSCFTDIPFLARRAGKQILARHHAWSAILAKPLLVLRSCDRWKRRSPCRRWSQKTSPYFCEGSVAGGRLFANLGASMQQCRNLMSIPLCTASCDDLGSAHSTPVLSSCRQFVAPGRCSGNSHRVLR